MVYILQSYLKIYLVPTNNKTFCYHCVHLSYCINKKLVLCYSNADVNAQNALGKKPLHLAAAEGHAQTVEALLAAGTKVRLALTCLFKTQLICFSLFILL